MSFGLALEQRAPVGSADRASQCLRRVVAIRAAPFRHCPCSSIASFVLHRKWARTNILASPGLIGRMACSLSVFLRAGVGAVVVTGSAVSAPDGDAASQKLVSLLEAMGAASPSTEEPVAPPVPSADGPLRELLAKAQASFADAASAGESAAERDMGARLTAAASGAVSRGAAFVSAASPAKIAVLQVTASSAADEAFAKVYSHFAEAFDFDLYGRLLAKVDGGIERYNASLTARSFADAAPGPHCDLGVVSPRVASVRGIAAFPGGTVGSVFGMDLGKRLFDLSSHARGPAAAGLIAPMALSSQALSTGMGLIQSAVAGVIHTVPPLVSPPAWNNQPLTCVPMVAGHNCFGSVQYPITMADFMVADVTDSMLDGYVASFPNTYAQKVGKTDDAAYKACFSAYMGMLCSSVFPRCTAPQSRDEILPFGGSAPVCLHMCVLPLVMCPGFWLSDLLDGCSSVSVPPMCTQASFVNMWRLPPQYASYDEAQPFAADCPKPVGTDDASLTLYDVRALPASPIELAVKGGGVVA